MKVELENSQEQLDAMIQIGDSMITQGKLLFTHLNSGDNSISTDSLSHLLKSVIKGTPFDLQLPSYDEAKSSGRLSLLNNKDYHRFLKTDNFKVIHLAQWGIRVFSSILEYSIRDCRK